MKNNIVLFIKGGLIGIANIIPGVSGGTMAVVLGIYEQLVEAIGEFFTNGKKRQEYIRFLMTIGFGALFAIMALSWLMDFLLNFYRSYTYMFFVGLIAGSIPAIYRSRHEMRLTPGAIAAFILGMVVIVGFKWLGIQKPEVVSENVGTFELPVGQIAPLLFGGILAGGSMIVPGISGSFMLVLLGQYEIVIRAVKTLHLGVLLILGIGVVLGVLIFARVIDIFLKRWPKETFYFILGLVVASIGVIFPGLPTTIGEGIMGGLVLIIGGWVAVQLERTSEYLNS